MVNWKLTRGKFRPLMGQVRRNSEETVKAATSSALTECEALEQSPPVSQLRSIVQNLSAALKGVGPATASALVAHVRPQDFPFMADEALEGVGLERKYTLPHYFAFREKLFDKREEVEGLKSLTLNDMSNALWVGL